MDILHIVKQLRQHHFMFQMFVKPAHAAMVPYFNEYCLDDELVVEDAKELEVVKDETAD